MHWNYRVIRHVEPSAGGRPAHTWFGIHEVYYDDQGMPAACTNEAKYPYWEEGESGKEVLRMMELALDKPVIDFSDFDPGGKYYGNSMWANDPIEDAIERGDLTVLGPED